MIVTKIKGRADPADTKLSELFDKENYKQALSDINRRLKKGPNDRLLMNKAIVLRATEDRKNQYLADDIVNDICGRDVAYVDRLILTALDAYQASHRRSSPLAQKVNELWDKTLKHAPPTEEWANENYQTKLFRGQHSLAIKIAQARMKAEPSRRWRMHYLLALHLDSYSIRSQSDNKIKSMNATLVTRFLEREIENTIKEGNTATVIGRYRYPERLSKIDRINSQQELEVAILILKRHGEDNMIAGIIRRLSKQLDDPQGPKKIAELKKNLGLLLPSGTKDLRSSFDEIYALLSQEDDENNLKGDWEFWKVLAILTYRIDEPDTSKVFLELIQNNLANNYKVASLSEMQYEQLRHFGEYADDAHRNALSNDDNDKQGIGEITQQPVTNREAIQSDGQKLANLSQEYFKRFCNSSMCFRDLRAVDMKAQPTSWFLSQIESHVVQTSHRITEAMETRKNWLHAEINSLKQDYYRVISNNPGPGHIDLLSAFVSTCLRLYSISLQIVAGLHGHEKHRTSRNANTSERHLGDDAAILAVMAMLILGKLTGEYVLTKCIFVLERVLQYSPHNYDALVLIIRAYLCLGVTGKAIMYFQKLDIKNVQYTSAAWIILTRISTLNPGSAEVLGVLQNIYNGNYSLSESYASTARRYLTESTWSPLLEHIDLFEGYGNSIAARAAQSELVTCQTRADTRMIDGPLGAIPKQRLFEYRELRIFPRYDSPHCQMPTETILNVGPLPQALWADMKCQEQYLLALIQGKHSLVEGTQNSYPYFEEVFRPRTGTSEAESGQASDLTESEKAIRIRYSVIAHLIKVITSSTAEQLGFIVPLLEDLFSVDVEQFKPFSDYFQKVVVSVESGNLHSICWQYLHEMHTLLRYLGLVAALIEIFDLWESNLNKTKDSEGPKLLSKLKATYVSGLSSYIKGYSEGTSKIITALKSPDAVRRLTAVTKACVRDNDVLMLLGHEQSSNELMINMSESVISGWIDSLNCLLRRANHINTVYIALNLA